MWVARNFYFTSLLYIVQQTLKGLGHAILGNFSTDQIWSYNQLKYENNGSKL